MVSSAQHRNSSCFWNFRIRHVRVMNEAFLVLDVVSLSAMHYYIFEAQIPRQYMTAGSGLGAEKAPRPSGNKRLLMLARTLCVFVGKASTCLKYKAGCINHIVSRQCEGHHDIHMQ